MVKNDLESQRAALCYSLASFQRTVWGELWVSQLVSYSLALFSTSLRMSTNSLSVMMEPPFFFSSRCSENEQTTECLNVCDLDMCNFLNSIYKYCDSLYIFSTYAVNLLYSEHLKSAHGLLFNIIIIGSHSWSPTP